MDTKGFNLRERAGRGIIAAALIIAAACGRSTTAVAPPDTPAATPVAVIEEEALPSTLSEARALRRAAKLDLYERGLRKLSGSDDASIASRELRVITETFGQGVRVCDNDSTVHPTLRCPAGVP